MTITASYQYIVSLTDLSPLLKELEQLSNFKEIPLDIETWGLDSRTDKLRLVQLNINNSIYILNMEVLDMKYLKYVLQILNSKESVYIVQNGKFDLKFIYHNTGVKLNNVYDLMIAESVITGAKNKYASLSYLLKKYLNIKIDKETRLDFIESEVITQEMLIYASMDVLYLSSIKEEQMKVIEKLRLSDTADLEMKIVPAVAKMEYDGVGFDSKKWLEIYKLSIVKKQESEEVVMKGLWKTFLENNKDTPPNAYELFILFKIPVKTKKLTATLESVVAIELMWELWRNNFNIGSHLQLKEALLLCGVEVEDTAKATLLEKDEFEVIKYILDYKEWSKKVSSFGEEYLSNIDKTTGRIHADFIQNGTETGRFSCVPIETSLAFSAEGWKHYSELNIGDEILGYDIENNSYVWTKVKYLHAKEDFVGKLSLESSEIFLECTEDHRWIVKSNILKTADKLTDADELLLYPTMNVSQVNNYQNVSKSYRWKKERKTLVWCPETECGTWVMKQGNEICVTGNCSRPNLQQVPNDKLTEEILCDANHPWIGRYMWRECFIPTEGYIMVTADYNQQEYKLVGQVTREPKIIDAYASGVDMHTATASVIFGVSTSDVTPVQRNIGKTVNFGLLYGMSSWALSKRLGIKQHEGEKLYNKIISGFPVFSKFKELAENKILTAMQSRTMTGRIRFFKERVAFDDVKEYTKYLAKVKREGFNHIIQGTAADMLKLALYYTYIDNPFGESFRTLLLVHDEIVTEAKEEIQNEAKEFLVNCMDRAFAHYITLIDFQDGAKRVDAVIKPYWSK